MGCQSPTKVSEQAANRITFTIDERTEFLRTAFNLCVLEDFSKEMLPCETSYYQAVKQHFLPFKDHPFIKYILI